MPKNREPRIADIGAIDSRPKAKGSRSKVQGSRFRVGASASWWGPCGRPCSGPPQGPERFRCSGRVRGAHRYPCSRRVTGHRFSGGFRAPLPCPSPRGLDAFGQTWTFPAGGGDGGGGLAVPGLKPWPVTRRLPRAFPSIRRLPRAFPSIRRLPGVPPVYTAPAWGFSRLPGCAALRQLAHTGRGGRNDQLPTSHQDAYAPGSRFEVQPRGTPRTVFH